MMLDLPSSSLLENVSQLKGKVLLITGGAAGFGKSTALLAAQHGARVVIADLKPKLTAETLADIRKAGGTCTAPDEPVDVTHEDSLRNAFDHCIKEFGQVPDVVYANAGVALDDHFEDDYEIAATASQAAQPGPPRYITTDVNLNGALLTCALAQAYWKEHPASPGEGRKRRLAVLSSMGGMTAIPGGTTYSTSKSAVLGYWRDVCVDLQKQGERADFEFYAICPFFAKTRIFKPALLLVLAGIPLVPVPLIGQTLVHIAVRDTPLSAPPGGVIILPDHGDPAMGTPTEYDPLSPAWTATMHARCFKTDDWKKVKAWKRIWRDVAANYYGTSSLGLVIRAVLVSFARSARETP
ncbi:hypothetical protein DB88DRAFT_32031 [Papiliotrema laurentii]|uniref:NAD(P)-binding protein n=1 Tax=Papiliotrema laurentii TaxID=5418 RepID=A0AAD9L8R3_PAPLA|nr:hypothetical protein DB88DRAFT_32031 [Papiliotrema laurentii]